MDCDTLGYSPVDYILAPSSYIMNHGTIGASIGPARR